MEKPEEYERIFLITLATLYIVYLFFIYFLRQTYIRIQRFGRRWLPWPKLSIPVSIVLTLFIMLYFKQDHSNRGHHHHHHYDENNPLWQYKYREFLDFVFDHTLGGSPITPRHTDDHIVYLYYGTLILLLIISFYIYSIRFFLDHHIYGFFMFIVALSLVYFPIHEISEKYSSIQYIDESNQIRTRSRFYQSKIAENGSIAEEFLASDVSTTNKKKIKSSSIKGIDKNNVASITTIKSKQPKSSSNRSRSIFVCKDSTKSMINSKSSIIPKQKMLSKLSTNSTAPFLSEPSYKNNSSVSKSTIKCQMSKVKSMVKN